MFLSDLSDHFKQICISIYTASPIKRHLSFSARQIFSTSLGNFRDLQYELFTNLFSLFYDSASHGNYFEYWDGCLFSIFKAFVPLKRNIRNILPPFYSSHSVHLFNKRCTALRRYLRLPSDINKQTYLNVLNNLSFSVDLEKIAYVDKFSETNSSLHGCFKLLRSLSCDSDIPETMFRDIPYAPLSDSRAIANGFNTFIGSVFNEDDHLFDDFSEMS